MGFLIKNILLLSLSGSFIYLILLFLSPLTKEKFSPNWHYGIIVITMMVFILPYGLLLPKIKFPVLEYGTIAQDENIYINTEEEQISFSNNKEPKSNIEDVELNSTNSSKINNFTNLNINNRKKLLILQKSIVILWLFGFLGYMIKQILAFVNFNKKLNAASEDVKDPNIQKVFYKCCKDMNLKRKIPLRISNLIGTPMIIGLFNPVITITECKFEKEILEMIFKHELMHYKRKDLWIKGVSFLVKGIHWFNPIIYIVDGELNKACELSCDWQVIKNMDSAEKKCYGIAIIKSIDNSLSRRKVLSTAMASSNKNILKRRLAMIKSNKKPRKLTTILSIMLAVIIIITGGFITSAFGGENTSKISKNMAVVAKKDGLWGVNIYPTTNEFLIIKGTEFKKPVISLDLNNVAYTYEKSLYVMPVIKDGGKKTLKVSDLVVSYAWIDKDKIIYSTEEGGINLFNITTRNKDVLLRSTDNYFDINYDGKDTIYAGKLTKYKDGENTLYRQLGIISYNLKLKEEELIVKNIPGSKDGDDLGFRPVIAALSKDGEYLYIWKAVNAGSANADGVGLGVYDVVKGKFINFNDDEVYLLYYKDNISINPVDSAVVAINNGGLRNMNFNKTIGIVDSSDSSYVNVLQKELISIQGQYSEEVKGIATMTPVFSEDGKYIAFGASKALENGEQWLKQPHNLYTVDIKTNKVQQLTEGDNFDFSPSYVGNGKSIVFVRRDSKGEFSLVKLENGKEFILSKDINVPEESFYGHYDLTDSIVVK